MSYTSVFGTPTGKVWFMEPTMRWDLVRAELDFYTLSDLWLKRSNGVLCVGWGKNRIPITDYFYAQWLRGLEKRCILFDPFADNKDMMMICPDKYDPMKLTTIMTRGDRLGTTQVILYNEQRIGLIDGTKRAWRAEEARDIAKGWFGGRPTRSSDEPSPFWDELDD